MDTEETLRQKFAVMLPLLDERQRRLYLTTEAEALGYGGIATVARVAGVSRTTLHAAAKEIPEPTGRTRQAGGGRKKLSDTDPGLVDALKALVDPDSRGDPMSPLRWTCKSTRQLAAVLTEAGHPVSHRVVGKLLRAMGFSLQANVKNLEGSDHVDRDAQFRHLNREVKKHQRQGQPVVSVDAKKKELIGEYKNAGTEWEPVGKPVEANVHDLVVSQLVMPLALPLPVRLPAG